MDTFIVFLVGIFIIELWVIWWQLFCEDDFYNALSNAEFWIEVFCAWVGFFSTGKGGVITETTSDGIIVREVFIGR